MAYPPLGLQLIVFGQEKYKGNTPLILDAVASAGYQAIEGGRILDDDPAQFREMLAERGLRHGGSHTGPAALTDENCDTIAKFFEVTGCRDLCNSGLTGQWGQVTPELLRETCDILNRAGGRLRRSGIHLHYHNHAFEFEPVGGLQGNAMDWLLANLDPDCCDLCIDVGWVHKAGVDPAEYLLDQADWAGYLHLKDHEGDTWKELGDGTVPWESVMEAVAQLPKARWAMIEQDRSELDAAESVARSRDYLVKTFGYGE